MNIKNKYKAEVKLSNGKKQYFFGPTVYDTTELCRISGVESYEVTDRASGWVVSSRRKYPMADPDYNPHSLRNIWAKESEAKLMLETAHVLEEVAVTA